MTLRNSTSRAVLYWAGPGLGWAAWWIALLCRVGNPRRMTLGRKRCQNPTQDTPMHFISALPILWRPPAAGKKRREYKKKSLSERACSLSRWLLTAAAQPNLDYRSLTRDPRPATRNTCPTRRHSIVSSGSSSLAPRHTPADMIARRLHLVTPSRSLPRPAGDVSITCNAPKPSEAVNMPPPETLPRTLFTHNPSQFPDCR